MKNCIDYKFIIENEKISNEQLINIFSEYFDEFKPVSSLGEIRHFDSLINEIGKLNLRFQSWLVYGKDRSSFGFGTIVQNRLNPRCFFSLGSVNK